MSTTMPRLRKLIPSMFHRRLALLFTLLSVGMLSLSAQLTRLTVLEGPRRLQDAERRLITESWTPTHRGRILDRKGRTLAADAPSFELAADYAIITGRWAYSQAAKAVRKDDPNAWREASKSEREQLIQTRIDPYIKELDQLWSDVADAARIPIEEIENRKQRITQTVQRMSAYLWSARLKKLRDQFKDEEKSVELADVARPIREQRIPHVILTKLDDHAAFRLRELADRIPGLEIRDASTREYPFEELQVVVPMSRMPSPISREEPLTVRVPGVATHVLGWMRSNVRDTDITSRKEWWKTKRELDPQLTKLDRGQYRPGDAIGASGIERSNEHILRGLRGRRIEHLDTGSIERVQASPGNNITLTLDIALQARVQALLDPEIGLASVASWHNNDRSPLGSPLNSSAVIIDTRTGEILALASNPSFTRRQLRQSPDEVFKDWRTQAWLNRAIGRPYQPGSIVKPLVLVDAVTRGLHTLSAGIECTGHFLPDKPGSLRCWIYRERFGFTTHSLQIGGPLLALDAIARSCNIYFYELGRRLGTTGIADFYRKYNVDKTFNLDIGGEAPGFLGRLLPRTEGKPQQFAPIEPNEAIMMGIGQGPVSWTPLHAADAYATLARKGVWIRPHIITTESPESIDLKLNQEAIDQALEGMRLGVSERYGTGNHLTINNTFEPIFNTPGIRVAGKTGTAQANPLRIDYTGEFTGMPGVVQYRKDSQNNIISREKPPEHAWTVVLAGPENAGYQYAIAVVVEYAGSGGRVAGPIANQLIHALISEGYLPNTEPDS